MALGPNVGRGTNVTLAGKIYHLSLRAKLRKSPLSIEQ